MKAKISWLLTGLVLIILVVLKYAGVISWSWWWVMTPVWFPLALFLCVFFIAVALNKVFEK